MENSFDIILVSVDSSWISINEQKLNYIHYIIVYSTQLIQYFKLLVKSERMIGKLISKQKIFKPLMLIYLRIKLNWVGIIL